MRLLLILRTKLGFSRAYQLSWPSSRVVSPPWDNVINCTLNCASQEQLLEICSAEDIRDNDNDASGSGGKESNGNNKLSAPSTWPLEKHRWCTLQEAILLPSSERYNLDMNDGNNLLATFLVTTKSGYVKCVSDLNKTLTDTGISTRIATPALVRGLLAGREVAAQMATKGVLQVSTLSLLSRLSLLLLPLSSSLPSLPSLSRMYMAVLTSLFIYPPHTHVYTLSTI